MVTLTRAVPVRDAIRVPFTLPKHDVSAPYKQSFLPLFHPDGFPLPNLKHDIDSPWTTSGGLSTLLYRLIRHRIDNSQSLLQPQAILHL